MATVEAVEAASVWEGYLNGVAEGRGDMIRYATRHGSERAPAFAEIQRLAAEQGRRVPITISTKEGRVLTVGRLAGCRSTGKWLVVDVQFTLEERGEQQRQRWLERARAKGFRLVAAANEGQVTQLRLVDVGGDKEVEPEKAA